MSYEGESADGMGSYQAESSSRSHEAKGEQDLKTVVAQIVKANGTATLVSQGTFTSITSALQTKFKATSVDQKNLLRQTLIYYFSVHGTSPDTEWSSYEYPITTNQATVPAYEVIKEIGLHRLKKYMGRFSMEAISMVMASPEFRAALQERAARAKLAAGQEYMAIDFVGKDGSLSRSEMQVRVNSRESLLNYRARNGNNIGDMRSNNAQQAATSVDARAVGQPARPILSFDS